MFGFNTGIFQNVGGAVSGAVDRVISFVETIIDTVKAKIATLWEEKPLVGAVIAAVSIVCLVGVVLFLPTIVGGVRAVGGAVLSGASKIASSIIGALSNAVSALIGRIGGLTRRKAANE